MDNLSSKDTMEVGIMDNHSSKDITETDMDREGVAGSERQCWLVWLAVVVSMLVCYFRAEGPLRFYEDGRQIWSLGGSTVERHCACGSR